jgi:hypothetical protein
MVISLSTIFAMRPEPLRATVQQSILIPYGTGDPEVVGYLINFDLRLINQSTEPIYVPNLHSAHADTNRLAVVGAETLEANGMWKNLFRSSWYDTGDAHYESCNSLEPGDSRDYRGMLTSMVLLRTQSTGFDSQPTLRLHAWLLCRRPDGKVLSTEVTTDAFKPQLKSK